MLDSKIGSSFRYKYIIVLLGILICGLIFMVVALTTDPTKHPFVSKIMEHLSTVVLVAGFTGALYEFVLRNEFITTTNTQTKQLENGIVKLGEEAKERSASMRDYFLGGTELRNLGIEHCLTESSHYDFSGIIQEAESLYIVLNDGRTWVGNYYQSFVERFSDQSKNTVIILMHPESKAIDLQADKLGCDRKSLLMKIEDTIRELKKAKGDKNSKLKILGHHFYNTMSVFISEEAAIVTPYFLSKVRKTPPVFIYGACGSESFYSKLNDDILSLEKDALDISNYFKISEHRSV